MGLQGVTLALNVFVVWSQCIDHLFGLFRPDELQLHRDIVAEFLVCLAQDLVRYGSFIVPMAAGERCQVYVDLPYGDI